MPKSIEYRFKIEAFTPDTLPMAKLAEYLADLANMLGETPRVHFVGIEEGSAVLINKIDQDAIKRVEQRISRVARGEGPEGAIRAYRSINNRLQSDNSIGTLEREKAGVIIEFPGRKTPKPVTFGPFSQEGSLDGEVIMIGGTSDPVPVHLRQGSRVYNCHASREVAKELGKYLFATEIRVHGTGRWFLNETGDWELPRFVIDRFEILKNIGLADALDCLRSIEGSGWKDVRDPWGELLSTRESSSEEH